MWNLWRKQALLFPHEVTCVRPADVREWLRQIPFQPFRLYVLETTSYEVLHSEFVIVKRSTIDLFFAAAHPLRPLAERRVTIALLHITRLESLAPESDTSPHGSGT